MHTLTGSNFGEENDEMLVEHLLRNGHASAARHTALEHVLNGTQTSGAGELSLETQPLLHLLVPPANAECMRAFAVVSSAAALLSTDARYRIDRCLRVKAKTHGSRARVKRLRNGRRTRILRNAAATKGGTCYMYACAAPLR